MPTAATPTDSLGDAELLNALPSFGSLPAAVREKLLKAASVRCYDAGATLFRAAEPAAGLFIILHGEVRVLRTRNGRQRVIHTEGPGGTLGEVPLFEGGTMPATAESLSPVRCLHVTGDALVALCQSEPAIAMLFLRRMAARIRGLVDRLDRDATLPVVNRVASFLLQRSRTSRGPSFSLGMTQETLAEELGTVREVIVRSLAQLRQDGVIVSVGQGRFSVGDAGALRSLAGG